MCSSWIAGGSSRQPSAVRPALLATRGIEIVATPLFVALVVIETNDLVFSLDSVPAVLSMTRNPLVVYSSNVMAMLGLRSLYFVIVATPLSRVLFLRYGRAIIRIHGDEDADCQRGAYRSACVGSDNWRGPVRGDRPVLAGASIPATGRRVTSSGHAAFGGDSQK